MVICIISISTVQHDESQQERNFKSEVSFRQLYSDYKNLKFLPHYFTIMQSDLLISERIIVFNYRIANPLVFMKSSNWIIMIKNPTKECQVFTVRVFSLYLIWLPKELMILLEETAMGWQASFVACKNYSNREVYNQHHQHLACVASVWRRGKGESRAREEREDGTREDRPHFDFPPFLRPATQAINIRLNYQPLVGKGPATFSELGY